MKAIADELFQESSIQLLEKGIAYEAEFFALRDGYVYLLTEAPVSERRVMIVERPGQKVVLDCVLHQRRDGVEVLKPLGLHQMSEMRKSERKRPGSELRAENIVLVKSIFEGLSFLDLDRTTLLVSMLRGIRRLYPLANIVLQPGPHRVDPRSRALQRSGLPIFAPRLDDAGDWSEKGISFLDYQKILSYGKPSQSVLSEISVPLLLRDVFHYGYLQVLSQKVLTEKDLQIIQGISVRVTDCLDNAGYFPPGEGSCQIIDLSTGGLGFLWPRSSATFRDFGRGEEVLLNLARLESKVALHASIRVIQSADDFYRIGVQFKNLTPGQCEELETMMAEG